MTDTPEIPEAVLEERVDLTPEIFERAIRQAENDAYERAAKVCEGVAMLMANHQEAVLLREVGKDIRALKHTR